MAKSKYHEEEEHVNHERWLVSYADFITLLFAFFVVLYAISSIDQKKVRQVESAVRWALHVKGSGGGGELPLFKEPDLGATTIHALPTLPSKAENKLVVQIIRRLSKPGTARLLVEIEGRKLTVRMPASRVFIPGGSELLPSALPTIDMIVGELRVLNHPIRIEGHTDATRSSRLSNWDLSALRAATVVRYIESTGQLAHDQLSLAGFADTRRRDLADNEEAHDKNRRIEFAVDL